MDRPDDAGASLRRRAILCVLGSSAAFTVAAALAKAAAPGVPTIEIMLFRSATALLLMMPILLRTGWSLLRTRRPWGHAARTAAGFAGMFGSFYGYATLPLATVTALGFAMPVFLSLLSAPLLGERLSLRRAAAVAAGLLGVVVVLRPWQVMEGLPVLPAVVVVGGVLAWALSMVSIRRMGQGGERNGTIVLWFALATTAVSALAVLPVWVTPPPRTLALLLGVGVVSAAAQWLMTEGYRSGEATMLAPFEYGAILYTVLMGWLIWGEVPGGWEFVGIGILVVSGLATWFGEMHPAASRPGRAAAIRGRDAGREEA